MNRIKRFRFQRGQSQLVWILAVVGVVLIVLLVVHVI
jgi:hypothetical protein